MDTGKKTVRSSMKENDMDRLEAFEKMMQEVLERSAEENKKIEELRRQGKDKTATYRQYMGNRLFYQRLLSLYKEFGLLD